MTITEAEYNAAAAWWRQGSVKAAAASLHLSEQTVKNQLMTGRRRMGVATTEELVKEIWKGLPDRTTPDDPVDPNEYRRLRYQFDPIYREKAKKWAREGMRRKRAAELSERKAAFDRLMLVQDGKCAICGGEDRMRRNADGRPISLSVDHDHQTGAIRELLCTACNMMLGCAGDQPDVLEQGAQYLRKHSSVTQHKSSGVNLKHESEAA
jgi:DNA-binding CsgD family transcriptional regulator